MLYEQKSGHEKGLSSSEKVNLSAIVVHSEPTAKKFQLAIATASLASHKTHSHVTIPAGTNKQQTHLT